MACIGYRKHAKPQPATEVTIARVALAALAARRHSGRYPDLITRGGAFDGLQNEFEIEAELQFTDHHNRRMLAAQSNEIAAANFALDGETEAFEETFDGFVKRGFQIASGPPCDSSVILARCGTHRHLWPAGKRGETTTARIRSNPSVHRDERAGDGAGSVAGEKQDDIHQFFR